VENQYNTQNSENLARNISTIKITENLRMIKFDTKDLYVNIPIDETLKITEQQLLKYNEKHKTKQIISILHAILKKNYFEYQDITHHPSKGVAMGSPISGTIAEIFLQHTENKHIKQLLDSKIIPFYTRYVDDIFIIYDTNRTTTDKMQTYLDHIHENLKLTPTFEDNTQINFLDILITRK
jgi:retron-type reverse transcriptase